MVKVVKKVSRDTMIFASFLEEATSLLKRGFKKHRNGCNSNIKCYADNAYDIGLRILKSIEGKCVLDFTFKQKYQAITLQTKPVCVNGEPEIAKVDPKPLFQRLIVAAESIYIYMKTKKKYLLMSYQVNQVRRLIRQNLFITVYSSRRDLEPRRLKHLVYIYCLQICC